MFDVDYLSKKHIECILMSLHVALKIIHIDGVIKQPREELSEDLIRESIYYITGDETVLNKE